MLRYGAAAAAVAAMVVSCVGSVILFQFNPVFQLIFKVGLVLISPSGFYQLQNTPVVELLVVLCYVCGVLPRRNEKRIRCRLEAYSTHTQTHTNKRALALVHKYTTSEHT